MSETEQDEWTITEHPSGNNRMLKHHGESGFYYFPGGPSRVLDAVCARLNDYATTLKATEEERDRAQGERDDLTKDIAHIQQNHDADRARFVSDYWTANKRATAAEEQLQQARRELSLTQDISARRRERADRIEVDYDALLQVAQDLSTDIAWLFGYVRKHEIMSAVHGWVCPPDVIERGALIKEHVSSLQSFLSTTEVKNGGHAPDA